MDIIDNKALLVKTRKPELFTPLEKHHVLSEAEGVYDVLVHWGQEEVEHMTANGFWKTPSPILKDYVWPGQYKPMEHQRTTASFAAANPRCFIFNHAGTGKTSAAIWAADYLMTLGKVHRVLVVCPMSIMQTAWMDDLFHTAMHRTAAVCHGSAKVRENIINGDYEFVIINFDGVKIIKDKVKKPFDLIIVDEANFLKTHTTDRWKAVHKMMTANTRLWMMTGTPAAQSPEDAYGLAKLTVPSRVPKYFNAWKGMVMQQIGTFKWVPKNTAKDTVFAALQPAIMFKKEDCLDLPDIMYTTRDVPMSASQEKYYNQMKAHMAIEAAGESITSANAAVNMGKLLQISAGGLYSEDRGTIEFDIKPRITELLDIVEGTDKKVIVFIQYTHAIERTLSLLLAAGISCSVINGDVKSKDRDVAIRRFQDPDDPMKVILIQPQAAAHGITLTEADTVVWLGPTPSAETFLQANARAHRKGQVNKVTVVMIQSSPAEKRMYDAVHRKVDAHIAITDLYKEVLTEK